MKKKLTVARVDDYDTSSNLRLRECHSGTLFKDKIEVGGIMISNKGEAAS